ncbi:DNA/RNA non-specific endonuclease [Georgenia sp. EYE_87]|uniref:DNA/RNA non-specific endonuclease n=1 Tax=Georgenia sp. EYE_87 TaxID=2853448 RepID=UPI0020031189|nr:DNA/RNA non-specific endonuclease [Georgenia sp. EYE_87]MCK6211599.1 DNA/RNA non-specific endonuclease [Georgenia sp. EYE_87]
MAIVTPPTDPRGTQAEGPPGASGAVSGDGSAPDGRAGGPEQGPFPEELDHQRELAVRRMEERSGERSEHEQQLRGPAGLAAADDPDRIAKRLGRLRTYFANAEESPLADALAESPLESLPTANGVREDERATAELLEKVINTADFLGVRYLESGVEAQRPIGRVHMRDARAVVHGYGTGFLVSPALLLTNHHVLPDADAARTGVVEFNYQDGVDGLPLPTEILPFDPEAFFLADRDLDFALVAVDAPPEVLARFGYNKLIAAQGTVIIGESVTIVQHPGGRRKQIVLRENRLIDIPELVLHYSADTEPGSSGSPVFNDQWEVVALHHASVRTPQHVPAYTFLNEGIRISRILRCLESRLPDLPAPWRPRAQAVLDAERADAPRPVPLRTPRATHGPTADSGQATERSAESPPDRSADAVAAQVRAAGAQALSLPATLPAAGPGGAAGSVTFEVPLRITVELGPAPAVTPPAPATPTPATPARAATAGPPSPADVPSAVAPAITGDAGTASAEAIAIDPDYASRAGYDPHFLGGGHELPLPVVGADLAAVASQELRYHHFSVVMHRPRRLALFTAVNIDGKLAQRPSRERDRWYLDPRLPAEEQAGEEVYRDNPLDRGHLVRRLDPAWGPVAKAANDDTFHFTNCTPQHHDFNAGQTLWLGLEDYILHNTDTADLLVSVVTGPVLDPDDPPYRGVRLPRQFWKVVAMVTTAGRLSATGYLLSQAALLDEVAEGAEAFSFGAYRTFQVPVRRIAALTGLGWDPYVAGDPLDLLEAVPLPREILRPDDLVLTAP